jgi:hypothetical protein
MMLSFLKKLMIFVVLAAVVLFGMQPENLKALSATIQFHFKLWDFWDLYATPAFPVALLFVVFFLLGMVMAGLHGVYERLARRTQIRSRDRKIAALEKEVGELRAQVAEWKPLAVEASKEQPGAELPAVRAEQAPPPRDDEEEVPTL